jgi:hypothetical protein
MRALSLLVVATLTACGGGPGPSGGAEAWEGVWTLTTENGTAPASYSLHLDLSATSFTSTFTNSSQSCSWTGTVSATSSEQTWSTQSATGPPCDVGVGQSRTAQWSLSSDENELTLDFTAVSPGTLQVYSRD